MAMDNSQSLPRYHVLLQFGQWSLIEEGCFRPLKVYRSKREAFVEGVSYAADHHGCVTIHREDGSCQEQHAFPAAA